MAIGYAILMVRSGNGPDSGWFLSHAFLLIGAGLLLPTSIAIRFLLINNKRAVADVGLTFAFIGGLSLIGQFAIDLVVGLLAVDQSEMIDLFRSLSASPIIALPFQSVGPIVFYIGLLLLASVLWTERVILWWAGLIATLGIIGIGGGAITGIAFLTFLGFFGMFLGFIPVGLNFFALSTNENARV